jgi:transcriptional regulator with XRE-family HTH domain
MSVSKGTPNALLDWLARGLAKPGKSVKGLAAHLGIEASAVSRMKSGERRIQLAELPRIAEYLGEDPPGNGKVATKTWSRDPRTSTPLVPAKAVTVVLAPSVWREVGGAPVALEEWVPTSPDQRIAGIPQYTCKVEAVAGCYVICVPYGDIRLRPTPNDVVHVRRRVRGQFEDTLRVIRIDAFGKVRLQLQADDGRVSLEYPSAKTHEAVEIRGLVVAYYTTVTF